MTRPLLSASACTLLLLAAQAFAASDFSKTVQPFVAKNCVLCHNAQAKVGGLDLSPYHSDADAIKNREVWERVETRIKNHEMPPKGRPAPPAAEVAKVTDWIDTTFARLDKAAPPDPGRVTARRLNRVEYTNTVRDLLGVTYPAVDIFPPDDSGYGFDNIGDVLSLSPVLMEKYLAAAEKISKRAVQGDPLMKAVMNRTSGKFDFPVEADYDIRASIAGRKADMFRPIRLILRLDGKEFKSFTIGIGNRNGRTFEGRIRVPEGSHELTARMVVAPWDEQAQDAYAKLQETTKQHLIDGTPDQKKAAALLSFSIDPATDNPVRRGMKIDYFEIRGPYNQDKAPKPASYSKIFICDTKDDACAHQIVESLAKRAYRRPVTAAETGNLLRFVKLAQQNGDSFDQGIRLAVEAMLVSPDFLFRIERDPAPDDPSKQHRVNDYELASRLSYFLWNSMPDDALFTAAEAGSLHTPEVLNAQVTRMLHDAKATALIDNFAGQWLQFRNLDSVKPDPDKFPEFDSELRADMKQETRLFVKNIMDEDRSILDFLRARYSFLNERLAKFYGVDGVTGDEFRKVDLTGTARGGLLTQASVLTVSSYPNRTSVVIRGKWVLENLLNAPPPPPPPDVPGLDEKGVGVTASLRQQMEAHRANAVCASCHTKMDPLGFGLENFNAIGKYRTKDGTFPIDASGTLPDGRKFTSAVELENVLASQPQAFAECITEKMLTYALGRGLERYDKPAVRSIIDKLAAEDYKFSVLVRGIVNSMPFQMRRGDPGKEPGKQDKGKNDHHA
jgi:hypothetical protein